MFTTKRSFSVLALVGGLFVNPSIVSAQPVPATVRPGWVVVGDMIVPEAIMPSTIAAAGSIDLWPGGVVTYEFDANVSVSNEGLALAAMAELESQADITFVLRTTEADYVHIESGSANFSYLGRAGGAQPLQLVSWHSHYVIIHELMHALGFIHEHQRTDRDDYVQINWPNVDPSFTSAFTIFNLATPVTSYDFDSVMHYRECAFTVCDCPFSCNFCNTPGLCDTITVPWPNDGWQDTIGQLSHLSAGDIAGLQYLYGIADCNGNNVHDFLDAVNGPSLDCNGNGHPDECELADQSVDDCNANMIPDVCEPGWDCNGNGISDWCDISTGSSFDLDANTVPDECDVPSIIRVDPTAPGGGDGANWAGAMDDLQAALAVARAAPNVVGELWLRAGTHRPASAGGDRQLSFELVNDLVIYGGFAGSETALGQRDPAANPTVLSGDLDGDDAPGFANRADNSHRVVFAPTSALPSAVLDGVIITGGNADGPGAFPGPGFDAGGGIVVAGRPTIRRCTFRDNGSLNGAGGAAYVYHSDPVFDGCTFIGNTAAIGGAVYNDSGSGIWTNCVFLGNAATVLHGGAMVSRFGLDPRVINCTLVANTAAGNGGGLTHFLSGMTTVVNCIAWGNTDVGGSGESAQLTLVNGGTLNVDYTIVEGWAGGFGGTGNSGSNPLFIDETGPDLLAGSGDENLRLAPGSPAIDAADNNGVPLGLVSDLDGNDRFVDDPATVDTGVGTPPLADLGPFEHQPCPADTDGNGTVDVDDLINVILDWATTGAANNGDVNGSGLVDVDDLVAVILAWGRC